MTARLPGYPCAVCRRAAGAVALTIIGSPMIHFCSVECARLHMAEGKIYPSEAEACKKGGAEAGAYLEQIGKTDLATLTLQEWDKFCLVMFTATCDAMRRMADDEIPF